MATLRKNQHLRLVEVSEGVFQVTVTGSTRGQRTVNGKDNG